MSVDPPDRALAGIADLDVPEVDQTPALAERRDAVADLGDALRGLIAATVATEVPADQLRDVASDVRSLSRALAEISRPVGRPSSVDDLRRGQRPYNPVVGPGNPLAPPMRVVIEDDVAIGTCTLGLPHEGPLTFAHGGISALLLDQIMGYASAAAGYPAVTGRLHLRYRTAVPLGAPLVVRGEVIDVLGVRVALRGTISLAGDEDSALVEADGRFLMLRPEQAQRLFTPSPSD